MDRSAGVEKLAGSRRRALIMINRKARSAATSLDEAIALLGDSGITVREEALPSPDQLVDVIQRHADTIENSQKAEAITAALERRAVG